MCPSPYGRYVAARSAVGVDHPYRYPTEGDASVFGAEGRLCPPHSPVCGPVGIRLRQDRKRRFHAHASCLMPDSMPLAPLDTWRGAAPLPMRRLHLKGACVKRGSRLHWVSICVTPSWCGLMKGVGHACIGLSTQMLSALVRERSSTPLVACWSLSSRCVVISFSSFSRRSSRSLKVTCCMSA